MKPNSYKLMEHAVEVGLRYGLHKWNKYDNQPVIPENKLEYMASYLTDYITTEMCDWFSFDEDKVDAA